MSALTAIAEADGALVASPLHEFWAGRSQRNDWVLTGHLTLPGVLDDWRAETAALAGAAGFADNSWRSAIRFTGRDLQAALKRIFSDEKGSPFAGGRNDAWREVSWRDARGFLRGAGRLAVTSDNEALLCAAMSDLAWFRDSVAGDDVNATAVALAGLRLAGPSAHAALRALSTGGDGVAIALPGIGPALADVREQGHADLWCSADDAMALAKLLLRQGIRPVGVRSADAWRVQAGLAQMIADWTPAQAAWDVSQTRRVGELNGPVGSFYLAEFDGFSAAKGFTSVIDWPPSGQVFGIGWSLLGQFQEPGPGIRFHRAATTD